MKNILEKILKEMENESKLAHEEMRRCARGNPLQFDEVKGYARAMEYVVDTIRSHMDEVLNCGGCSRRKWYQKGYEDGKKDNRWIPVSERLPEKGTYVMCCFDNGEVDVLWQNWKYDKSLLYYADIDNRTHKVIAWQPLPKPYKEEKHDDMP